MAVMIPEKITSHSTPGEQVIFYLLRDHLPNSYIVWYELDTEGRYPDFVILGPEIGILVLEVKDWTADNIIALDQEKFTLNYGGQTHRLDNPKLQGNKYKIEIMRKTSKALKVTSIVNEVVVNNAVCFTNIERDKYLALRDGQGNPATNALEEKIILFKDDIEFARRKDGSSLVHCLQSLLVYKPKGLYNQKLIEKLRAVLDSRIILKDNKTEIMKKLEIEQEQIVKMYPEGNTLIRGNAGSGKSVILSKRAEYLSDRFPDSKVLFLCFNVALASSYNISVFKDKQITVYHYHSRIWSRSDKYDFIFIDEGQDFELDWYKEIISCLSDSPHSHICIASDGAQIIYDRLDFSFNELGIKFSHIVDLKYNYRNTEEICTLSEAFLLSDEEILKSTQLDLHNRNYVSKTLRKHRNGIEPVLYKARDVKDEYYYIISQIKEMYNRGIRYSQIGILFFRNEDIPCFQRTGVDIPTWNINEHKSIVNQFGDSVQLAVVNSGKGLEFDYVFLCGFHPGQVPSVIEKKRTYVGFTRAVHGLTVVYSDESTSDITRIIEEIFSEYQNVQGNERIIDKYHRLLEKEKQMIEDYHIKEQEVSELEQENENLQVQLNVLKENIKKQAKAQRDYSDLENKQKELEELQIDLINQQEALNNLREGLKIKEQKLLDWNNELGKKESDLIKRLKALNEQEIAMTRFKERSENTRQGVSRTRFKKGLISFALIGLIVIAFMNSELLINAIKARSMSAADTISSAEQECVLGFRMIPIRDIRTTYGTIKDGEDYINMDGLQMKGTFKNGFEINLMREGNEHYLYLSGEFKAASGKEYLQISEKIKIIGPMVEFVFHNEAIEIVVDGTHTTINEKLRYLDKKFTVEYNIFDELFYNTWIN